MEWLDYVVSILSGLVITIPLVVKLVEFVKKSIREKNWGKLLDLVMKLMQEAEDKFDDGDTKKDYVMALVKTSADFIDYDIDINAVGKLIDDLCKMTKVVNAVSDDKDK